MSERLLTCTRCNQPTLVYEASSKTLGPHEWLNQDDYVCAACLLPQPQPESERDGDRAAGANVNGPVPYDVIPF
jgi:hypothetical protein